MDRNLVSSVIVLLNVLSYTSGEIVPRNVTVHIWEGNVTVTWDPPQKKPGGYLYQVQIWMTSHDWVTQCNGLTTTVCSVGYLPSDSKFRVRVGVIQNNITWTTTKVYNIRDSEIFAPTFVLSSTSNSVQVQIHRNQIPEDVFPYGVQYTSSLWPDGQEHEVVLKSDDMDDNDIMIFSELQSLRVYCVHVEVESKATSASNMSPVQCIKLPLETSLIFGIMILVLLVIVASFMCFVCLMKRSQKMPAALKSVIGGWRPMTIGPDQVETVTNKAWILIANEAETKIQTSNKNIQEQNDWRESLDSGVSMDRLNRSGSDTGVNEPLDVPDVPADSGCGSLKRSERSQYSPQNLHRRGGHPAGEDSGLGMGRQEISDSLEGEEIGLLSEVVVGHGYRSQSPSSVEETPPNQTGQHCDVDTDVAYRSGQVTCTCVDFEYCIWCKSQKTLVEYEQPRDQDLVPNYLTKGTVLTERGFTTANEQSVFVQENVPGADAGQFLVSCSSLLLNGPQSCLLNTQSFRLDEVELTLS